MSACGKPWSKLFNNSSFNTLMESGQESTSGQNPANRVTHERCRMRKGVFPDDMAMLAAVLSSPCKNQCLAHIKPPRMSRVTAHLDFGVWLVSLHVALVRDQVVHELARRDGQQLGGVCLIGHEASQRVYGQPSSQGLLLTVHHVRLPIHLRPEEKLSTDFLMQAHLLRIDTSQDCSMHQ